jgi:glycosyltransferase involved in cell wall biosynthesis
MPASKTPLVSIVIPIYHPPGFFEETIESIKNQTYANFEVIISDDVPKSDYEEWVSNLADPSWKIIKNRSDTKGIFSNLNNAIRQAEGEFIQILCQDDVLYPDCLERQVEGLLKYPSAGMIFSDYDSISNGKTNKKAEKTSSYHITKAQRALNKFLSRGCLPGNLSPVMLRKDVFQRIGYFKESFHYAGDFEYWVRIFLSGLDYVYNPACLLALRVHEARASHTLSMNYLIKEEAEVYSTLLNHHSIRKNNYYLKAYINQKKGIRHIKGLSKQILNRSNNNKLGDYWNLNQSPFNLFLIILLWVLTLNGKLAYFKINEQKDF